jgi:putative transposase
MLLKQILLPPGGLFTLAAVLVLAARVVRIPARWPAVASVAVAWLVCTLLVGETALTWHHSHRPLSGDDLVPVDDGPEAVVVLSSDLRARHPGPAQTTLDAASTTRSLYAAAIAATADLPILVTGGPSGRSGRKIAPEMARFIGRWSAAEVRWIEPRARNTWENARYAAAMLAEAGISRAYLNGVQLDFFRPGKLTDNAFVESFNGKFRAECLNQAWFLSLEDARSTCEAWRVDYNEVRPHSAISQKTPAELARASGQACLP